MDNQQKQTAGANEKWIAFMLHDIKSMLEIHMEDESRSDFMHEYAAGNISRILDVMQQEFYDFS